MFLRKSVLQISSKFTGGHPHHSVISIKLQSNYIENALRHGYSPVHLLNIFRTAFPRNASGGGLFLKTLLGFFQKRFHRIVISICQINP